VIAWAPAVRALVENVAEPAAERAADPRTVVPSRKFTLPFGTPAVEVTVAVKLTDCPWAEGLGLETSVVDVPAGLTVCCQTTDVLPRKLPSPEYVAVIEWTPPARAEVEMVAEPAAERAADPIETPPSKNVTLPVRVPDPGATTATVAVKVADCPNTDGLGVEDTVTVVAALLTVRPVVKPLSR
jgi:hypothetical protein